MEQILGRSLQTQRKARRLTIQALAAQAGVHRTTISRWERGEVVPFTHELARVLEILKVSPAERQVYYLSLEAPRAIQIASAGTNTSLPVSSGELLRALRQRANLSQRTIARAAHVAQSLVVKWEQGECWPSMEHLHAFCFAIGANEDELVFLTTRAWRHMDPLPMDKDALDHGIHRLELYDNTTTRAGTYLALAARYHELYRMGKISEVEAGSVFGSYAYYMAWRLRKFEEAARLAAPVLAGLERSRGMLSRGQRDAVNAAVIHNHQLEHRSVGEPLSDSLRKSLQDNLALLNAVSKRYDQGSTQLHLYLIALTFDRAGNSLKAEEYYTLSIESTSRPGDFTLRNDYIIDFLCSNGRFEQAAARLLPTPPEETRPSIHVANQIKTAKVYTGLGELAAAERLLARATETARQSSLDYFEPMLFELECTIEARRNSAKENTSQHYPKNRWP